MLSPSAFFLSFPLFSIRKKRRRSVCACGSVAGQKEMGSAAGRGEGQQKKGHTRAAFPPEKKGPSARDEEKTKRKEIGSLHARAKERRPRRILWRALVQHVRMPVYALFSLFSCGRLGAPVEANGVAETIPSFFLFSFVSSRTEKGGTALHAAPWQIRAHTKRKGPQKKATTQRGKIKRTKRDDRP